MDYWIIVAIMMSTNNYNNLNQNFLGSEYFPLVLHPSNIHIMNYHISLLLKVKSTNRLSRAPQID